MKLQIERPYAEAMIVAFPQLAGMQDQLRFGDKVELRLRQLSDAQIGFLGNLYRQAGPALQGRAAQLATLQQALNDDGTRFTAANLEMVVPAIARFLMTGADAGSVPALFGISRHGFCSNAMRRSFFRLG